MIVSLGEWHTRSPRFCCCSPAPPSLIATTSTTSLLGESIIWTCCAGLRPSTMASPAPAGFAPWSTASIQSCLDAASRPGSPRSGRIATSSSPSTARPRVALMITAKVSRPSTRSAPMRPTRGSRWRNFRCPKDQRDHRHPRASRSSRQDQATRRRSRHHRCHGHPGGDRRQDPRAQG